VDWTHTATVTEHISLGQNSVFLRRPWTNVVVRKPYCILAISLIVDICLSISNPMSPTLSIPTSHTKIVTGSVTFTLGTAGKDTFNVGTTGIEIVMLGTLVIRGGFCPNSQGCGPGRGVGWKRFLHC
jgi:hypothetical protein